MLRITLALLVLSFVLTALPSSASAQALTPQQRADLRKLRNLTIEVENQAGRMKYYIEEWKGLGSQVGDKRVADFNTAASAFAAAYQQAQPVAGQLPAGNAEVDELVNKLNASLETYNKAIADAQAMLENANKAVEDVGGREQIQKDITRIDEIASQFSYFPNLIEQYPGEAVALLAEYRPALQEIAQFEEKYADFLQQNNADTAPIRRELDDAKQTMAKVASSAKEGVEQMHSNAAYNLDFAEKLIDEGVAERKPLYFRDDGGVPQHLENAENFIRLARAVDADSAAPLVERYAALKQKADAAGKSLQAEIIAGNKPPADAYSGSDHDELAAGARAAWAEAHPDDEIVKVVIPTADWDRETKWTWWRDAFYFTDVSSLQASVIIKAKSETGEPELHYWPVNIRKDHEKGDAVTYSPWEKEPLDRMPIHFRMLADKLN